MKLYFKKYEHNTDIYYDMREFLNTDGSYNLEGTTMVDQAFKADDGLAGVIVKPNLVLDKNYMIAPSVNKVYKIVGKIYLNTDSVQLQLVEDFMIPNYTKVREFEYLSTRAFPYTKNGVIEHNNFRSFGSPGHDISPIQLNMNYQLKDIGKGINAKTKVALLFFKIDQEGSEVGTVRLKLRKKSEAYTEKFNNLTELYEKYPNDIKLNTRGKGAKSYADKLVKVNNELYRFIIGWGWTEVEDQKRAEGELPSDVNFRADVRKMSDADVSTIVLALPFSEITSDTITFDQFVRPIHGTDSPGTQYGILMDIKIVDSQILNIDWFNPHSKEVDSDWGVEEAYNIINHEYRSFVVKDRNIVVNPSKSLYDLSTEYYSENATTISRFDYSIEPFKEYYLSVYGNRHKISYYLLDKIRLVFAISSEAITYNIVEYNGTGDYDMLDNKIVIDRGEVMASAFFTVDEKDEFYSQNPKFRSQMNTQMVTNATKNIVQGIGMGAIAGGPPGAIAGGAIGLVGAGIDVVATNHNKKLSDQTMEMRPDKISGKISEGIDMALQTTYGIFWVVYKTTEGDLTMRNEYFLRGMPISKFIKIKDSYYNSDKNTIIKDSKSKFICGNLVNDTGGLQQLAVDSINGIIEKGIFIRDHKEV